MSILLVLIHHLAIRFRLSDTALADFVPKRLLSALSWNGYEAVMVFFVISGFLISTHTLARHGELARLDARAFYARRFARIVPPLVAIVAALSVAHLLGVPHFTIDLERQSLGRAVIAAFGVHLNWYEGQTGYLPGGWDVLWSLSVEEAFYLIFPLVCLAARRDRVIVVLALALALSLPWVRPDPSNEIWREKAFLPGMAAIGAGVVAAWVAASFPRRTVALNGSLRWIGGLGLASVLFAGDLLWPYLGEGMLLWLTTSVAMMLVGLHGARGPGAWWLAWLRSTGRWSYEIYLTHMFVVFAVVGLYRAIDMGPRLAFLAYVPMLIGSWVVGVGFGRWFSQPADRALRARFGLDGAGVVGSRAERP